MKGNRLLVVLSLAVCVVVIAGEMYAYLPSSYGYSSDADFDGDTLSYSVGNRGSDEFDAILLDNGGYVAPSSVYIYYDIDYATAVNEDAPVEVGAQQMTVEYYIDQLIKVLRYRGMTDVSVIDALGLSEALSSDVSSGTCGGRALVMCSGAIPDTIFSGDGEDLLPKWLESGGSIYWAGNVIGRYVASGSSLEQVDSTSLFIGTDDVNESNTSAYEDASDLRAMYSFEYNRTMYSPDISGTDRKTLVAGYTDGTYASITFVQMGRGQVCVIGGEFNSKQIRDLATSICSGLCYGSSVIDYAHGVVDNSATGVMHVSADHGNLRFYVYIGGYFCTYGQWYSYGATTVQKPLLGPQQ